MVTSPQDASSIYRNTATLKFDEHVEYRRKMYEIPGKDRTGIIQTEKSRHLHKALAHAVEDFYRQQLYPGNHLDDLWTKNPEIYGYVVFLGKHLEEMYVV